MRGAAHLVLATSLALVAAGCTSGTTEPRRSATCGPLQAAVEGAQREVEVAISDISSDPGAASARLTAVRQSLVDAEDEVSETERTYVTRADDAAARLSRQAEKSASGNDVNGDVVGAVRAELLDVVQDVRADC